MKADRPLSGEPAGRPASRPTVGVVVTTYNDLHFLPEALQSVLSQTQQPAEVIVVDDGSKVDPSTVIDSYPGVRLIRQPNRGLGAARNTGLRDACSNYLVFLDADDRLDKVAIEAGLACFQANPTAAFVYGAFRFIGTEGKLTGGRVFYRLGWNPYGDLLRSNIIGMHATVMYRRELLLEAGGFDEMLTCCEDYDLYLRIARRHQIACHPILVAEYRRHNANMSSNAARMLRTVLSVQGRQPRSSQLELQAWADGRAKWTDIYARQMSRKLRSELASGSWPASIGLAMDLVRLAPKWVLRSVGRSIGRSVMPRSVGPTRAARAVNFGDLGSETPLSSEFGFDRGQPIDRYYIERFLEKHSSDLAGRALEIGDDSYCRRFGGTRITRQDILHIHPGNPRATLVGDLAERSLLPDNTFDCIILTQTLHLVFDFRRAIANLHSALKPGGVLLLTVPGISQLDRGQWHSSWFWAFTPISIQRLFCEEFGQEGVNVEACGNVFAATAFLQGIALEEVDRRKIQSFDPAYPLVIAVRARKFHS